LADQKWDVFMHGLKVGHYSDFERGTGVSVFLFEGSAAGGYVICGSAPATHELATLDAGSSVPRCHALVLAGGSAYGLFAAAGVMRYLGERGIGQPVPAGVVPVVPVAAIYDMAYQQASFPSADHAYQACLAASEDNVARGRVGAGTGATVGKLIPATHCMTGGLGRVLLTQADGLEVLAYVVVNSVGDIHDQGAIIAGAKDQANQFADCEKFLLAGHSELELFTSSNTTLAMIVTNASFSKAECQRIAKMAVAGLARAIAPVFTCFDGDIVFCMSVGEQAASELTVGTMAAEALRLAVINAVQESEVVR
jgi:L-aminopeptidase/D-esterase-like protein